MKCPKCGSDTRTVWCNGRKLQYVCNDSMSSYCNYDDCNDGCDWKSDPFTPPKKSIRATKTVSYFEGGNYEYELFDQYGHTAVMSQGFSSKSACEKAARKDIERMSKSPDYGKCTAVIWPKTVKVVGKKITP